MAIFQDNLGKLVPECPFWISLELRMMEVVVTTGAKLHSKRHHQQNNT